MNRTGRLRLDRCTILVDERASPPMRRALQEAREYLSEITGSAVPVASRLETRDPAAPPLAIGVGPGPAFAVAGGPAAPRSANGESFRLRTGRRAGQPFVSIAGSSPAGTARGLSRLLGLIELTDKGAWLPSRLDLESAPRLRRRGMHLNGWAANHPYSFRCWREEDWRRYIDIIFHLGANLLFLWPSMDILPVPLSRADEAYLEEVRRVVAYAKGQRGMEVWVLQSANRVALSDAGVADPRLRPYWLPGVQVDLDPGQPDQLDAILASREPLYRVVDNADGVVIIDSDPGGWKASPVSVYLELLRRTRGMLDRWCLGGPAVSLVSWLWQGWGHTSWDPERREPVIAEAVRSMQAQLPEPWMLVAGTGHYLPYLRRLDAVDRTVYLPYGAIEAEPSVPFTNVDPAAIHGALAALKEYPDVAGVMGNAQCPLLQLPQTHHLLREAWEPDAPAVGEALLLDELARLLHPADAAMVAEAMACLNAADPSVAAGALARCRAAARSARLPAGIVGRLLFPSTRQVIADLARQLEVRRAEAAFACGLEQGTDAATLVPLAADYFRQCLRWEEQHGYFGVLRVGRLASLFPRPPVVRDTIRTWPPLLPYASRLRAALERAGDEHGERFFVTLRRDLSGRFDAEKVERGCIAAMQAMMVREVRAPA